MIEEPKSVTVNGHQRRPSKTQVNAFAGLSTSVVSDALWGQGAMQPEICPLLNSMRAQGPALTIDCRPGDILGLLAGLAYVQPGDVVICATQGHRMCATIGDRVVGMLQNAGAAGFVTDGTIRDADGIEATGLPIWSTGITPASPVSNGPGRVGFPVHLAGQRIETGDMVMADRDGVTIVPFAQIDQVAARAREIVALEEGLDAQVRDGLVVPDAIRALLDSDAAETVT